MTATVPASAPARLARRDAPPAPVIETRGLVKQYGAHRAVDGLDLTVFAGEIFGILGPNGAGKTTTLEMIEGLREPDAGTVRVAGLDPVADGDAVRRRIGVQLQATALFDYLSVAEIVELFAGLYGVDDSPARVARLIDLVGLGEKAGARIDQLSGGQKQRVAIALALVNEPEVVFLDEPTTGLDPVARRVLWATVRAIRDAGATVVLTTHYMEEAEILCDRVAVMDRGRIIACDTPAGLVRDLGASATIRARLGGELPLADLAALPAVTDVAAAPAERSDELALQTADAQATLVALLALAAGRGVTLAGLSTRQANLEDVFLALTGRAWEGDPNPPPADEPKRRRRGRSAG